MIKYMRLKDSDKKELLNISRQSIISHLKNEVYEPFSEVDVLNSRCGAFVTLYKNNKLRGCIGRFNPDYELYKVVRDVSLSSAFQDSRFKPVLLEEMDDIKIEISVLTPFKKIKNISEIELGKHGVYIINGNNSGTFLPQVAIETGWTLIEFLGHCSQDKMGMGWHDWKNSDIFTYEAEIFNEKEILK